MPWHPYDLTWVGNANGDYLMFPGEDQRPVCVGRSWSLSVGPDPADWWRPVTTPEAAKACEAILHDIAHNGTEPCPRPTNRPSGQGSVPTPLPVELCVRAHGTQGWALTQVTPDPSRASYAKGARRIRAV